MNEFVKTLVCANCGVGFKRRHDRVLAGNNFCQQSCRSAWTKENVIGKRRRECEICGNEFTPRAIQIANGQGRFCSNKCSITWLHSLPRNKEWRENISKAQRGRAAPCGPDNPMWKGGRYTETNGYVKVNIAPNKYRREHREVMEAHLGRVLGENELVHHKNHDKTDNRVENLEIMSRAEHAKHHLQFRRIRNNGRFA